MSGVTRDRIASRVRRAGTAVAAVVLMGVAGCGAASPAAPAPAPPAPSPARTGDGGLRVTPVAGGFSHVWSVGVLPDGRALVTERSGRLSLLASLDPGTAVTPVAADLGDVFARGEGGLMGLAVHADFATSNRFTTCQTHAENGNPVDVRLVTWTLSPDGATATRVADPLVGGLPIASGGRHSGCRVALDDTGALVVGTGDAAMPATPQDLTSLGGKTLRVDPATGGPAAGNPFADAADPAQRLVHTSGHRNVQGVAVEPGTGRIFTAEHGPTRDDEVNLLRPGANYGWDPSQGGTVSTYDESVPMTDRDRFPDAVPAAWSSGSPPEAPAGAAFLDDDAWGPRNGMLAVAALRGQKLLLMRVGPAGTDGAVSDVEIPTELDGEFGRLRGVHSAPDGALLVTTSNGDDDRVLRVDPS
ncbi:PQQ-dependent sugar dehydrogenase [Pseudonocardia sp. HH130629-09]|uniref:PQQ-dependent sugar dehydrogenase n=1 Tax=Pseudonocardia sp. HH130629-09 TaxID=1641402 RepID=UPI0006CB7978|nr:PQQ-dependent sugar dehydrogenase [Pseudonocardia sp. HH130629-09]ALE85443.1 glucose dehydrogenase [Pseudonocardia sp. HH130629-09]